MAYKFDNDFGETKRMPYVDPQNSSSYNQWNDFGEEHISDNNSYNYTGAETWKYGEGQYDYIANEPGYGDDWNKISSSQKPPWFHYFVIDNIKYVIAMVIFYFLFTSKLDSLGIVGGEYTEVKGEMIACFILLSFALFIKSLWRLHKMR